VEVDVAIIGGGPAGAIAACLTKQLRPELDVAVFEAAQFPRDHVGESLLPIACAILDEAGCWEKIEAEGFPVKLGAFYRWGITPELIRFPFLQDSYQDRTRPGEYAGQRVKTTWQVDRGIFDKVLLDHAKSLGCKVYEGHEVSRVVTDSDRVSSLQIESRNEVVKARYYVDASGVRGMIRRAIGVETEYPTSLRNIAVWDYWRNAEWIDREGQGTYIRILSLDWGWLWFITIGESRTSVGLVTSAEYYKQSGLSTEELYQKALQEEPHIGPLLVNAEREYKLGADKDWSYLSSRLIGENWFLAGDSCGFADPILSAGITLALSGSRKIAYTIKALEEAVEDPAWVRSEFERTHRANIKSHIRFADFWYKANKRFSDLEEYCSEIAKDSGLTLDPKEAFQWIATGGFTDDYSDQPMVGTYTLSAVKTIIGEFTAITPEWQVIKHQRLKLNLDGAARIRSAVYRDGTIKAKEAFIRGDSSLLIDAYYRHAYMALNAETDPRKILELMGKWIASRLPDHDPQLAVLISIETLEAMLAQGWIVGN
jgi:flavin-dependent dehydrogenase